MIDNLIINGCYISCISSREYALKIENLPKQIKGKSEYDNCSIVEYLPKNKEFYVIDNENYSNEGGYESYYFSIAVKFNKLYFVITDSGSN